MIEVLPPLGKYKYDTSRILPVKCYIDNLVCLRSCIRNVNRDGCHTRVQRTEPKLPYVCPGRHITRTGTHHGKIDAMFN
jgi:hypothetical protein